MSFGDTEKQGAEEAGEQGRMREMWFDFAHQPGDDRAGGREQGRRVFPLLPAPLPLLHAQFPMPNPQCPINEQSALG